MDSSVGHFAINRVEMRVSESQIKICLNHSLESLLLCGFVFWVFFFGSVLGKFQMMGRNLMLCQ